MKLIINGDDFGLNISSSQNIIKCFENGLLSSTSIITTNPETHDLIKKIGKTNIDCGIHLTLTSGISLSKIDSLTKNNFLLSPIQFYKNYLTGKIFLNDIFLEFSAQVEFLRKYEIELSHIDTHLHIHLFPGIFKVVLAISEKYNIPVIRNHFKKTKIKSQFPLNYKNIIKYFLVKSGSLYKYNIRINSPEYILGFYDIENELIYEFIKKYKNDDITVELLTHPEKNSDGRWNMLLNSENFKEFLDKNSIKLIDFKED